ncbi:MAG: hydrogenase maturation nickel metallochaperone HypA [Candidatus Omnitrophica bacterium]|nr:hydrogenase maturation nickel metallochaperone HypA [Candidatus Omnitrophota bacterium]
MHESHQVQRLINDAQQALTRRGLAKARKVSVLVGELMGFDEGSLQLHWEEMVLGTSLEGAELVIEFVPAKLQCPKCKAIYPKKGSALSCPACQVIGVPMPSGKEFCIKDIV